MAVDTLGDESPGPLPQEWADMLGRHLRAAADRVNSNHLSQVRDYPIQTCSLVARIAKYIRINKFRPEARLFLISTSTIVTLFCGVSLVLLFCDNNGCYLYDADYVCLNWCYIREMSTLLPPRTQTFQTVQSQCVNPQSLTSHWSNPALHTYVTSCSSLAWQMAVQAPPMTLSEDCTHFDDVKLKLWWSCDKSKARTVDYVIWPVLYDYEGGNLMVKGCVHTSWQITSLGLLLLFAKCWYY